VKLRDDIVALRPWRADDVDGMLGFADPLVQRFSWPLQRPYTEADARAYLAALARGDELGFALVEPADDGAVLGGASLYDHEPAQARARIGYWLAPAGRGRGVATHAVRLLADWAFAELRLARLEITCAPDNLASQRVAERGGFTREGLLRSHMRFKGGRRDTVVFGRIG
jgi:RimJ/RimL family protein N-acetyltransferase